jgi:NAD(P)-dependent dehydrogenase (short-subunit alcohol dehydrogenase family)
MPSNPSPHALQDRVILVTGAGQGLGHAAALAFAGQGATVILLGKTTAKLEQVYDEITAAGGPQPAIFPMDLEKAEDPDYETLAQTIGYQLRRLDGILHCAAAFESPSPLRMQSNLQWLSQFKVNVVAPFAINRVCQPLLAAAPAASVILVGETHGHAPAAYWGGFAVSKAALEAYFRIQAEEWAGMPNLCINLVIPGPINTPQRAQSHPGELKAGLADAARLADDMVTLMQAMDRTMHGRTILWSAADGIGAG